MASSCQEYHLRHGEISRFPRYNPQTRKSKLGGPIPPARLWLPSSKCKSGNCGSRKRCMSSRLSYTFGVGETGIGSTSQNGYLSVGYRRRSKRQRRRIITR